MQLKRGASIVIVSSLLGMCFVMRKGVIATGGSTE